MNTLAPRYRPRREVRIAQIIGRLNIGGPAIYAVTLADHFNRRNYRSLLITGEPGPHEGDMSYLLADSPAQVVKVQTLSRDISPVKDLRSLRRIVSLLRRFRPHIVHTHTAKAGFLGRMAAMMLGIRNTVHTFHGHTFSHYFTPLKNEVFMSVERLLAHHTAKIIAVSARQRRDLVEAYRIAPARKVVEIPQGLDLSGFLNCEEKRELLRSRLHLSESDIVVGIAGRLYPIKAHDFLILSAAELLNKHKHIHVIIVGDGDERPRLEEMVKRKGLESNIHFLGWQKDMPAAYAAMDIIALTSRNEGSPFSLIEGMASGLPAVATAVGGVPDLFPDPSPDGDLRFARNGILVGRRDPGLFARALERLIDKPEMRKEMARHARQFAISHFAQNRLLADMEDLYLSLLPRTTSLSLDSTIRRATIQ